MLFLYKHQIHIGWAMTTTTTTITVEPAPRARDSKPDNKQYKPLLLSACLSGPKIMTLQVDAAFGPSYFTHSARTAPDSLRKDE